MLKKNSPYTLISTLAVVAILLVITKPAVAEKEKILHSFNNNGKDGTEPAAGLIFDASGNLYGTSIFGGSGSCPGGVGCGTVFELAPEANGKWAEKALYSFQDNGIDGFFPFAALVFDGLGNLYGTTQDGGSYGHGTVFELRPKKEGGWTESVIHSFNSDGTDGTNPQAGLIFDAAGNLYGAAANGGSGTCSGITGPGCGMIFELMPNTGGEWIEKVLYEFKNDGNDGSNPYGTLIFDAAGNVYGTTAYGGANSNCISGSTCGTVFELEPSATGVWKEKVLHNFNNNLKDGTEPTGGLIFDSAGNLYGTTSFGGSKEVGTVFELELTAGRWSPKILHSFSDNDGAVPSGSLIFDGAGNLYGTTDDGGTGGLGTVFQLVPESNGDWSERVLHSFAGAPDGSRCFGGLIFDNAGNLYGTTDEGGTNNEGAVFEIRP